MVKLIENVDFDEIVVIEEIFQLMDEEEVVEPVEEVENLIFGAVAKNKN